MNLYEELEKRGLRGRVVSASRVGDVLAEIEGRLRDGTYDEAVYKTYFADFTYGPPDEMPNAASLIIVASPQPVVRFTFLYKGKSFRLVVPPTYFHGTDEAAREILAAALGPAGYRVILAAVPKKLLAARSGLAAYGKNNVAYVPGMGSFFRLSAFYSDLPPPAGEEWREPAALERCGECELCGRACPTGAIAPDRFLLHAERCITFHNEQPPEVPFPAWLEPAWHDNCVVGCLRCQRACPEDENVRGWVEDAASFSEEETALLLEGVPLEELPPATAEKLRRTGLADYAEYLPRNLGVLIERKTAQAG